MDIQIYYPDDAMQVLTMARSIVTTRNVMRRRVTSISDKRVGVSRGEEGPVEAESREEEFETERSEGLIENGGDGGELIAVRGHPGGEQAIHTEVTGGSTVTDCDSSE